MLSVGFFNNLNKLFQEKIMVCFILTKSLLKKKPANTSKYIHFMSIQDFMKYKVVMG